eukprot:gene9503-19742_t
MSNFLIVIFFKLFVITVSFGEEIPFVSSDNLAIPSILIPGISKAGTTDVHFQLIEIFDSIISGQKKEIGMLNRKNIETSILEYSKMLKHSCANKSEDMKICSAKSNVLTIDATPYYLHSSAAALNLKKISPNTKVIILLRPPIERTESLYNHWRIQEQRNLSVTLDIQNSKRLAGYKLTESILDSQTKQQYSVLLQPHFKKLIGVLKTLKKYGYFVLGFNDKCWRANNDLC